MKFTNPSGHRLTARPPSRAAGRDSNPPESPRVVRPMLPQTRRINAWVVTTVNLPRRDLTEIDCQTCGAALDLHQPDVARPDEILGICAACGAWHVLTQLAHGWDVLVIELPPGVEAEVGRAGPPEGRAALP
jgi:hypothetical protein